MARKTAYFAIGYKCNHRCIFCPRDANDFEEALDYNTIIQNIDKVVGEYGVTAITISGGEPTIQTDFLPIMKHATQRNILITLLTNADRFCGMEFAKEFASVVTVKNVCVVTAIHSTSNEEHDRITGCKGSFEHSLVGLKNLQKLGFRIGVKFIISKQNYKIAKEYIQFILDEFHGNVVLLFCGIDCSGSAGKHNEMAAVNFQDAKPYIEDALDYFKSVHQENEKANINISEMPLCSVDPIYWKYFSLKDPNTKTFYSAPNCKENEQHLSVHVKNDCGTFFEACRQCKVNALCPGVWFSTYQFLGENAVKSVQ